MLTGMFKTFEELEENLSVEELHALVEASSEREFRNWRFAAGLKGVDLDAEVRKGSTSSFDKVKARAEAKLAGKSEEELKLSDFGIAITKE